MAVYSYFEVVNQDDEMWLKIYPSDDGGEMVELDEIISYLDVIKFPSYDVVSLGDYLKRGDFSDMYLLCTEPIIPENERCIVNILGRGERALARFYPPTTGGGMLTESDIISDLKLAGIKHGIHKKAIDHFLANHEYCRDYIIADATMPVQGHNAVVKYFFDINTTAKPKLNEDGSVDFHQLGNIKPVEVGQKLAELTPADRGRKGISVTGATLNPVKVKTRVLRYGRNIRISKDKCTLYSEVAGHVTLVDDMVMVSDIYRVPANVDSSTGDIEYQGTVEVAGNVSTGFKIQAEGDIVVNGVVEGATLISGGNIVLKRGMQGMDRGELQAEGNIIAKFLENCKVKCNGSLKADAVLHSQVECRESIDVLGKKGLINGGVVKTYASIQATTLGSTMGSKTELVIYSDIDLIKQTNEWRDEIKEKQEKLDKIEKVADTVKKQLETNVEVSTEQMQFIKNAISHKPLYLKEIKQLKMDREDLLERIERNKNACILVEKTVYPGTKVTIKDMSRNFQEKLSHCRLIRDGADVRIAGF